MSSSNRSAVERYSKMCKIKALELIKTKCLPIRLYGLEACPLNKTNLKSLDFPSVGSL